MDTSRSFPDPFDLTRRDRIRMALLPCIMMRRVGQTESHPVAERIYQLCLRTLRHEFEQEGQALRDDEIEEAVADPLIFLVPKSIDRRRRALQYAVLTAISDGKVTPSEAQLLDTLNQKLRLDKATIEAILDEALADEALARLSTVPINLDVRNQLRRIVGVRPMRHPQAAQIVEAAIQVARASNGISESEQKAIRILMQLLGWDDVASMQPPFRGSSGSVMPTDPRVCWMCVRCGAFVACADGLFDPVELSLIVSFAQSAPIDPALLEFTIRACAWEASVDPQSKLIVSFEAALRQIKGEGGMYGAS